MAGFMAIYLDMDGVVVPNGWNHAPEYSGKTWANLSPVEVLERHAGERLEHLVSSLDSIARCGVNPLVIFNTDWHSNPSWRPGALVDAWVQMGLGRFVAQAETRGAHGMGCGRVTGYTDHTLGHKAIRVAAHLAAFDDAIPDVVAIVEDWQPRDYRWLAHHVIGVRDPYVGFDDRHGAALAVRCINRGAGVLTAAAWGEGVWL